MFAMNEEDDMNALSQPIRIANVQAFWGDYSRAPAEMLEREPELDYLTMDYLAEVSMSILAKQMRRDSRLGYARDFLRVLDSVATAWNTGSKVKVVSNAGGLTPMACAEACAAKLKDAGCDGKRIGVVTGDSVLQQLQCESSSSDAFRNLDTGEALEKHRADLVTANAYIGAQPIVQALDAGADMVITGRVADPSMVVGPCIAKFGWADDEYNRLAGATVAGHLIECGTQVTGGISSHWSELSELQMIGYPIVEVSDDGSCVVTKSRGTGGSVDERSVKEQLLYELGDPGNYLSPDVCVSFLGVGLESLGEDRIRVAGAVGRAPPTSLKVSGTYHAGYHSTGSLVIYGRDAVAKAKSAAELVLARLARLGLKPAESRVECLGAGAIAPMDEQRIASQTEVVLRVSVADNRREVCEQFASDWISLVCCGPQGTTGYAGGRPRVHETIAYWPCLIEQKLVEPSVEILEV